MVFAHSLFIKFKRGSEGELPAFCDFGNVLLPKWSSVSEF